MNKPIKFMTLVPQLFLPNIQMQKAGAEIAFQLKAHLPASDLERWRESRSR
jgi:hypothetical protein